VKQYIDGRWVEAARATVPFGDAGFQFGVGVFTTVLVREGCPVFLADHLRRLVHDAAVLGFRTSGVRLITAVLADGIRRNRLLHGVAKIILTPSGSPFRGAYGAARLCVGFEPPRPRRHDVSLLLTAYRPSAWRAIKSLSYLDSIVLLQRARAQRLTDALACDRGELLETGTANLFAVSRGVVFTPPADGRILPGIVRARLLADRHLAVQEATLTRAGLRGVTEILLTNCVRGVIPVRDIVNGHGNLLWRASESRPFTRLAAGRWRTWLDQEVSARRARRHGHETG
jgi:para-aminobenzoate synthetase/4-amino-4-deoxychorismate lyase